MKRQMKMTTSKEPQKKFMGGSMAKKAIQSVAKALKDRSAKAPASEPVAAPSSAGFGRSGRGLMGKIAQAVQAAAGKGKASSATTPVAAAPTSIPAAPASSGRGRSFRGLGRALASVVNKKKKQEEVPGMKKGGAVMKDKMGRAMKKTTADAKGRAMRKGK
jgi:hypothetical protein